MPKKKPSHDFYSNEIDKWILKEAKLRARYARAVEKGAGPAAARIAQKIQEAQQKQTQLMNDWRLFITQQQQEEALCQKTGTSE